MRIIAGEQRGRRIEAPPGKATRPMLDRVREAVFSTLGERIEGAYVLDLFGGTGSLALEALSRGARGARSVEQNAAALRAMRANVASLGFGDRAQIVAADALARASWGAEPVDVVFVDPPYGMLASAGSRARVLDALGELARIRLAPGGIFVLHAQRGELSERELGRTFRAVARDYGASTIWYLEPPQPEPST